MKSPLNIAVFSDIHLGHRRTPTESIVANLQNAFLDGPELEELDLLIFSGDVFDRLLNVPSNEVNEIQQWITYVLRVCKKRGIRVRVLEGTPSHDWRQPKQFETLNQAGIDADLVYHDTLELEWIEELGVHLLYIPDEWKPDLEDVWQDAQQVLYENGVTQVDFVIMHGMFTYQVPAKATLPAHDPDRYAGIARQYVICGHVHTSSQYENILVPGSFDRLAHGEEEPKGHWRLKVHESGDDYLTFVENEGAWRYDDIDIRGHDADSALVRIRDHLNGVSPGSFIRLLVNREDGALNSMDAFRKTWPQYQWSPPKIFGENQRSTDEIEDLRSKYQATPITPRSIEELTEQKLRSQLQDESWIPTCLELLKEHVHE